MFFFQKAQKAKTESFFVLHQNKISCLTKDVSAMTVLV